jgi:hypothetical protein
MAFLGSSTTPAEFSKLQNGIEIAGDDITDGNSNVIYDQSNNELKQDRLENDTISFTGGDGVQTLGDISLGGSLTIGVEAGDLLGSYLSEDGDNDIRVNLGRGLVEDPNNTDNIAFDESLLYTFTSSITLDAGGTLGDVLDADGSIIENLPSPSDPGDAARKRYVDGVAQGLEIKQSSVAATTSNIDLSSTTDPTPIDGVSISNGDIILVKEQNDATENGLYVAETAANPSTWTRTEDFNEDADVASGSFTFVENGDINASTSFTVTTEDPISLGSDPITWQQFASAGEIAGGFGLSRTGQTLDVSLSDFIDAEDGLQVSNDSDIVIYKDSSLTINGSGQLALDTSNTNTFSASQNFNAGLDVGADISDGTDTIWDSSNGEVPDSALGSIANDTLTNDSITVTAGDGLATGGSVSLGNSITLDIKPGDFIDSNQFSVSNGDIEIDDIFLSNTGDTVSGPFTFGDFFDLEPIGEPSAPGASDMRVFVDSNDNNLKAKADDGSVVTLVTT